MIDQLYKGISDETFSRINQIDKADEFDVTQVERGILSIHARWSGQSIVYGKSILNLIDNSESQDFDIKILRYPISNFFLDSNQLSIHANSSIFCNKNKFYRL